MPSTLRRLNRACKKWKGESFDNWLLRIANRCQMLHKGTARQKGGNKDNLREEGGYER